MLNLLDNAIKFSSSGSRIEVSLRGSRITVMDEGHGIAAEDQPHIWDRFWRAPAFRGLPGSGLGLSIVGDVVARHGGTLRVVSPVGEDDSAAAGTAIVLDFVGQDGESSAISSTDPGL